MILIMAISFTSFAQVFTSDQTINTNQTYATAVSISTGNISIASGTTTINNNLSIGNDGVLVIKSGATVIVNGVISVGNGTGNGRIVVEGGGKLIVNPGGTGSTAVNLNSTATSALDVQSGGSVVVNRATPNTNTSLGIVFNASSKATIAGSLQIRGGGLSMNGSSTLTYSGTNNDTIVGDPNATGAYFSNNTVLTVGAGVNLYIKGDAKNDSYAEFVINGNVSVVGNYQSGNYTANVTGDGNLVTTGSLDADSYQGSVFGERYTCATGPCDGRKPCGQTATSSPAIKTLCSGPTPTILTASLTGGGTKAYQWQSSSTSTGTFTNITGATLATYSANPSSTYYYRAAIVVNSCTTFTSKSAIIIGTSNAGAITGSTTSCTGLLQTYSITSITGVTNYTWTVPSGATIQSGTGTNSISVLMGSTGGNITVSATNACGTGAISTLAVTASTVPAAAGSITGVTAACQSTYPYPTFSIGAVTGATGYTWTLPSGSTISSGANTNSIAAQIGSNSGNIVVSAKNGCGNGTSATLALIVSASRPAAPGSVIGSTTVCSGSTQTYSVAVASDATSYAWTLPPGSTVLSGGTTNSITIKMGTQSGQIETRPSNICGTGYNTSNWFNITVNPSTSTSPSVTAALTSPATTTICAGTSISLKATPTNGGSSPQYQWKKNGVNISTATNATYSTSTVVNNDKFTVTLTNTALCPSIATSNEVTITVNPIVTPSVTVSSTSTTICAGSSITLTATPTNGGTTPTYVWKKGGNTISGETNATYTTTLAANNDSYTVTMTSNAVCPSSATATSTAVIMTVNPSVMPSVTASSTASTICAGTSITLTATPTNGGTTPTYVWKKGGTAIPTATNATYTTTSAANNDTYTVTMTSNAACPSSATATSTAVVMTVNPLVIPSVTTSSTATTICAGTSITLTANPTNAGTTPTYQWKKGGSTISGETNATYTTTSAANNDSYTVTMTSNAACASPGTATSTAVVITVDNACSYTWTGATSVVWNVGANWSLGYVPSSTNDVVIPATVTSGNMPIVSAASSAKSLTNNGSITFASHSGTLNVYGNISNNGTIRTDSGSTINMVGSSVQTITSVSELGIHNLRINNISGVSLSSDIMLSGTLSLTKGVLNTNNHLTINFDAGGNIGYVSTDAGSVNGSVKGKRNLIARTHYISSPFIGATSGQIQATTPLYVGTYWKMYTRTFATQNWAAVTNLTTTMSLGTGFSLSLPSAAPIILSGTYNHNYSLTGVEYSNVATTSKYMFIGNPYPSTLDWDNGTGWTKTNVANAIYFWDPATSKSASYVAGLGTNGATKYIPAMQAFLVELTGTGGLASVSINNNARISLANPSYFRVVSDDVIRITLTNSTTKQNDEAIVRFNDMATNAYDFELDAHKIINTGAPSVYTTSGTELYSINSYERVDSAKNIPLSAKLLSDGKYTLSFTNNNPNVTYVLLDKQLGLEQTISEDYTFDGLKTDDVNRFELQLRETTAAVTTGVQSSNKSGGLQINSSTRGFVVKSDLFVGQLANMEILDLTGNRVAELSGKCLASSTFVPLDIADGSYVVKVNVGSEIFTALIVLVK